MKFFPGLFFLLLLALSPACNRNRIPKEGTVKAHVIEYRVNYLNEKAGSIPTSVLPKNMTAIFANNVALTRIDGFFGQFSLRYISNSRTNKVTNLLKIFDKMYVYYGKAGELPIGMKNFESMILREESADTMFAGYKCRKLKLTSSDYREFEVLCTGEIDIKNPNRSTPYKAVDEVLLRFNVRLSMLDMQLNLAGHSEKEVPWESFNVPSDYVTVSRQKMENVINELFK